jgi:integration host factor subunit alpha
MTLTKAELADLLFEKVGLNKREAKDMVEAFSKKSAMRWNAATA